MSLYVYAWSSYIWILNHYNMNDFATKRAEYRYLIYTHKIQARAGANDIFPNPRNVKAKGHRAIIASLQMEPTRLRIGD